MENIRFYPPHIQPFAYEPTRDNFEIISNINVGEGIITKRHFYKGEIVYRFTGELLNYQTLFTLQKTNGEYIHDPYFMGKTLHCCDPNTDCDMTTLTFTARRDIMPGEYITMDYDSTEEELYRSFFCQCGSLNCRGWIKGYKFHRVPLENQTRAYAI